ncbi:protein of unknown function [Reichenbachiella faecimaris]|uniref:DUF4861 domain-containing protein n=1 Tax=Reichenbachiella faecimaris TaxID=692418 RepID=A0A1W2G6Q3_REIFA|nr:DUF4861 family protein [Reichenbachiella faecimaris]SMD32281.1 protein of unknown function [Reichenbachiella faecimaris]
MIKYKNYIWVAGLALAVGCGTHAQNSQTKENTLKIKIENSLPSARTEVITLSDERLFTEAFQVQSVSLLGHNGELLDTDQDGWADQLVVHVEVAAQSTLAINWPGDLTQNQSLEKKVQAEISPKVGGAWQGRKYVGGDFQNVDFLSVPAAHTDHSYYIRYEGPGIENELVGYRFYLDWRNAMDIFGKKVDTLVLQSVGLDGFDSYHEDEAWGMDVLKAGKSLGIGSIGQYINGQVEHFQQTDSVTCQIKKNNKLSAAIETSYYGWETSDKKSSIISNLSIRTGDRALKHTIKFDQPIADFCTGIVKHDSGTSFASLVGSSGWAYLATYGKQSLADDNLGMAIFYNTKDVEEVLEASYDHLIVFKPAKEVNYYLLGAWAQEKNAIKNLEAFHKYLDDKLAELNQPLEINIQ